MIADRRMGNNNQRLKQKATAKNENQRLKPESPLFRLCFQPLSPAGKAIADNG